MEENDDKNEIDVITCELNLYKNVYFLFKRRRRN